MQRQTAMAVTGAVLLVAFLAFVAIVVRSPADYVYDEVEYVMYVPLLRQHGLTREFLELLPGAAGPLYALVHAALEPVTALVPIRMRLVNVSLLVVVAGILAACLRRLQYADFLLAAASVLVVPMTWVLAGMALTEMPAMALAALSLYLQLRALEALERGRPVLAGFAASALCLGVAVWGRQPYLVLAGVPVLLALMDRRMWIPALIFVAIVLAFTIPFLIVWRALVPPIEGEAVLSLAPASGLASLGYTAIGFFLLAPRLRWLTGKPAVLAAVAIFVANGTTGLFVVYPFQSVVEGLLPPAALAVYGRLYSSLLLACGAAFLVTMLNRTWQSRRDLKQLTINAGLLSLAVSPALIGNFFSSRYAAVALPYLVLAAQPWREWGWKTGITTVVGCGAGLLSLLGYFRSG